MAYSHIKLFNQNCSSVSSRISTTQKRIMLSRNSSKPNVTRNQTPLKEAPLAVVISKLETRNIDQINIVNSRSEKISNKTLTKLVKNISDKEVLVERSQS